MPNQPGNADQEQGVEFLSINGTSLVEILKLPDPRFIKASDAQRQLSYVERYVRDSPFDCKTVVLEHHYIDRDHMEDHSVFYSKSLYSYPNYCRRIHFFSLEQSELRSRFEHIRNLRGTEGAEAFSTACAEFSRLHYIGFAVIKPLPGCPVGRTVLRCLPEESGKGHLRKFNCACDYDPHLLGLRLTVTGLAFQQQDLGVSACATTALWTALQ
ncbi:MAG: hypothetical protein WBQ09_09370, partial [Terriglobales bacterium]